MRTKNLFIAIFRRETRPKRRRSRSYRTRDPVGIVDWRFSIVDL